MKKIFGIGDRKEISNAVVSAAAFSVMSGERMALRLLEVKAEGGRFSVKGKDMEKEGTFCCGVREGEGGRVLVSARAFSAVVRALSSATVRLEVAGADLIVVGVEAKEKFSLPVSGEDFPSLLGAGEAVGEVFSVEAGVLLPCLESVALAVGAGGGMRSIVGMLLEVSGSEVSLTGTDGKKLFHKKLEVTRPSGNGGCGAIVPVSLVTFLSSVPAKTVVSVRVWDRGVVVDAGDSASFFCRAIEGQFPPYKKIIDSVALSPEVAKMNRVAFKDAVERVSSLCEKGSRYVELSFGAGELTLSSTSANGDASVCVDSEGEASHSVRFNSDFLISALSVHRGETITFCQGDAHAPAIIKGTSDIVTVIVPLRVN